MQSTRLLLLAALLLAAPIVLTSGGVREVIAHLFGTDPDDGIERADMADHAGLNDTGAASETGQASAMRPIERESGVARPATGLAGEVAGLARPQTLTGWPSFDVTAVRFAGESRDPEWSAASEHRLLGTIAEFDNLQLYALEAVCRQTICRLKLVYPDEAEPTYVLRQVFARTRELGLGPASSTVVREPGEPRVLWVFLRRTR